MASFDSAFPYTGRQMSKIAMFSKIIELKVANFGNWTYPTKQFVGMQPKLHVRIRQPFLTTKSVQTTTSDSQHF